MSLFASQDLIFIFAYYLGELRVITVSVINWDVNPSSVLVVQDLKYIYGRYINPSSEEERNMYVNSKSTLFLLHVTSQPVSMSCFLNLVICHFPSRVFSNSCCVINTYRTWRGDHEGHFMFVQHFKWTLLLSHQTKIMLQRGPDSVVGFKKRERKQIPWNPVSEFCLFLFLFVSGFLNMPCQWFKLVTRPSMSKSLHILHSNSSYSSN